MIDPDRSACSKRDGVRTRRRRLDPDNALYDAACDLLAAARAVSRAAQADGVEPAVPATLGCIGSTLGALAAACSTLPRNGCPACHEPFEDLVSALRRAESACDAARAHSGHLAL